MKKLSIIFAACAAAFLAGSCAKEPVTGEAPDSVKTILQASLSPLTKTEINGVKVTWSAGDAINVNGVVSNPLAEAAETGTFTFRSELKSPYKAIYPASLYKDATTVTLPASISIDAFDVPLTGYAESGKEVSFKALTALVKLSITGEAATTLKDITLKSAGAEQLSGDFTIDYATGALTGASEAEADQEIKVTVGKALSSEALTVYIPVPAGTYASGYEIDLLDSEGGLMKNQVSARTLKAGELRIMPDLAFAPNVEPDQNIGGIPDAAELKAFRDAVNDGLSIARWLNTADEVELLSDIDLGGEEWTPIGNASVTNAHVITGNAFTGIFNGGGHTIDNFKVTLGASAENAPAGLFGAVSGATIKDLTIGDKAVIKTSSNSGFVTLGGVAGFAGESTLENLDSKALLINDAGKNSTRLVIGGTVGTMFASETKACTATGLKGHASFNVVNSVNTGNGSSGFIVGGVIGWTDGKNLDYPVSVNNCVNYSSFSVQATRTAGVIGTMNSNSKAEGCVNYGNISCTDVTASNSRPSGIVSAMGTNAALLKDCINYGDIAFAVSGDQTHGYAAGVVGQTNDGGEYVTVIDGCASYGAIQSDRWYASEKFMGIICASFNTKKITVKNCILGGKIGPYTPTETDPVVELTASNFEQYYSLTAANRIANVVFNNNSFGGAPAQPGIASAEDLVAFAAAVNAGTSTADWQNDEGVVTLLNDIDCSSISSWTPIGVCTLGAADSDWAHNKLTVGGTPFTGKFDGKNHRIKNLHMSFTPTKGFQAWGLFGGIGDGGEVKNLIIDASSSMHISTGKNGVFGVVAGLVADGTMDNVKNYAPVTGGGTSDLANNAAGGRVAVGGVIGWAHAITKDITLSNLYNAGAIGTSSAEFSRGGNSGNGANGFMLGGVVGFSTNSNNTQSLTLSGLKNDADIYTNAGRASGIVSSANRYTLLKNIENTGSIYHSGSGGFRLGLITCIMAAGCEQEDCVNTGNLIAPNVASAAAFCCLVNDDSVKFTRCRSIGATIVCTGFDTDNNTVTYAGAFYGQCNKLATFSNCAVSGKVGKSTDALLTLTAENYFPFVGQANASNTSISSDNIKFAE